ncbi:MAG: CBS domain-containing protein, partial [Deltaproteobacteria bacterium]
MKRTQPTIEPLITRDFPAFKPTDSIEKVLSTFRHNGLKHKIIYLYVVDESNQLMGVVPVHRLLTASPHQKVADIYVKRCISLSHLTSVSEARKAFSAHKFLAFPVVDSSKQFSGVLNIEAFAGDLGDISAHPRVNDLYELFGLSSELKREKSFLRSFAFRFPWLLATFTTGTFA